MTGFDDDAVEAGIRSALAVRAGGAPPSSAARHGVRMAIVRRRRRTAAMRSALVLLPILLLGGAAFARLGLRSMTVAETATVARTAEDATSASAGPVTLTSTTVEPGSDDADFSVTLDDGAQSKVGRGSPSNLDDNDTTTTAPSSTTLPGEAASLSTTSSTTVTSAVLSDSPTTSAAPTTTAKPATTTTARLTTTTIRPTAASTRQVTTTTRQATTTTQRVAATSESASPPSSAANPNTAAVAADPPTESVALSQARVVAFFGELARTGGAVELAELLQARRRPPNEGPAYPTLTAADLARSGHPEFVSVGTLTATDPVLDPAHPLFSTKEPVLVTTVQWLYGCSEPVYTVVTADRTVQWLNTTSQDSPCNVSFG